ncbi:MarR family transcriptional regulator [Microbacteriaceae bacterium VKM Ac-2855]|nr:MarR family transcriptional regulator [Microbacteriaceae bacterium VKM Ac-2855]
MTDAAEPRGPAILDSLKKLRAAETSALRRDHPRNGSGETDLLALLHLVRAARAGRVVFARDLARHLAIAPASVTTLIDRLQKTGLAQRHPDPNDRRGTIVTATHTSDEDLHSLLSGNRPAVLETAAAVSDADATTVIAVIDSLTAALDAESARQAVDLQTRAS